MYNRVFVDTNKIATMFGRDEFRKYIQKQLSLGNLVRIKNRSPRASESTPLIGGDYSEKTPATDKIPQKSKFVNTQNKNSKLYSEKSYASTFYSRMGRVIDDIKQDKVGANSVVPYLKGKGVKNEEIKWSGKEMMLDKIKAKTKK